MMYGTIQSSLLLSYSASSRVKMLAVGICIGCHKVAATVVWSCTGMVLPTICKNTALFEGMLCVFKQPGGGCDMDGSVCSRYVVCRVWWLLCFR